MAALLVETAIVSEASHAFVGTSRSNRRAAPHWLILLTTVIVGTACAKASAPGSPSPSGSPPSLPALKLAVLDAIGGHLAYCDPDQYPVAHGNPLENAKARFPTIRGDRAAFDSILRHEHLSVGQQFTPDQLIVIDNDYKQMQAIDLTPTSDGYSFSVLAPQKGSDVGIWRVRGTVSRSGAVSIERREIGQRPSCPICLVTGVRIATPNGEIAVQDIRVDMTVWTTDRHGRRIAGVVLETGHMQAPLGHEVVRLTLTDGRTVVASPGHPTADGSTVGDLEPGDRYGGSVVGTVSLIPYSGVTWDLLPSGPTGTYFANGVLLGSALRLILATPGGARR